MGLVILLAIVSLLSVTPYFFIKDTSDDNPRRVQAGSSDRQDT